MQARDWGMSEIWTYNPNPWWMLGGTEIEINVASNIIQGYGLED